ncbi:MAG: RodZ domain-containing protein [Acidobacteriota bacterium]
MTPQSDGESFGTWLRQQREVRDIDLRQIAERSKISMRYLQALEGDRFDLLPASVFAKGFLKQYAGYVGIDPDEVINFYLAARQRALDEAEDEPASGGRGARQRRDLRRSSASRRDRATGSSSSARDGRYALGLIAIVLVLIGAVALLSRWSNLGQATDPPTTTVQAAPAPAAVDDTPAARDAAPAVDAAGAAGGPAGDVDAAGGPAGDADGAPADDPSASADAEASDALASALEPTPDNADLPPLRVTIDFVGNCWVQVAADGRRVISEERVQGESLRLTASTSLALTLGNASAARIELNGQPFDPPGTVQQNVRRVTIDLDTVRALEAERTATTAGTAAQRGMP